jgi:hypothetical protein
MATALNFTAPLRQDPESQKALGELKTNFAQTVQPLLDATLARSEIVHFARVVVIEEDGQGKYIQILTEYDGDPIEYTKFFLEQLSPLFESVFALVEGAPPWEELKRADNFVQYTAHLDLPSLGTSGHEFEHGFLFSAVGDATVKELAANTAQPA